MSYFPYTGMTPLQEMVTEMYKAQQSSESTTTTGSLFHRESIADLICLEGAPEAPFLQRLKTKQIYNTTHYWRTIDMASATGTSAFFVEGEAPDIVTSTASSVSNTVFNVGKCARVTDKQEACFQNWRLQVGYAVRRFLEELRLQTDLRMMEIINEMDYIFLRGDQDTTVGGESAVQCDGALTMITSNVTAAAGATVSDSILSTLAKTIIDQNTRRVPTDLYVTSSQKKTINSWAVNIFFTRNRNLEAGKDVSMYNSGFFEVPIIIEPNMASGVCAYIDHSVLTRCNLKDLQTEPLARTDTGYKMMISGYFTLEMLSELSSGQVTGMAA